MSSEEFYVCAHCGYDAGADRFGKYCPACGVDLDELEAEIAGILNDNLQSSPVSIPHKEEL